MDTAVAGGEFVERHAEAAADAGFLVLHLAGEIAGGQPLGHRIGLGECAIDLGGRAAQHTV